MYSRITRIINETGLHARPASDFIACAKSFESKIKLRRTDGDKTVDAKSIILLMTLALSKGTEIELIASGADEKEAVDSLVALIESGFEEV